jgi:hypothetical protein
MLITKTVPDAVRVENAIKKYFDEHHENKSEYGREYYAGNETEIKKSFDYITYTTIKQIESEIYQTDKEQRYAKHKERHEILKKELTNMIQQELFSEHVFFIYEYETVFSPESHIYAKYKLDEDEICKHFPKVDEYIYEILNTYFKDFLDYDSLEKILDYYNTCDEFPTYKYILYKCLNENQKSILQEKIAEEEKKSYRTEMRYETLFQILKEVPVYNTATTKYFMHYLENYIYRYARYSLSEDELPSDVEIRHILYSLSEDELPPNVELRHNPFYDRKIYVKKSPVISDQPISS